MFSAVREVLGNHRSLLTKRPRQLSIDPISAAYLAHAYRLTGRRDHAPWIERELNGLAAERYVPKIDMRELAPKLVPVWNLAGR